MIRFKDFVPEVLEKGGFLRAPTFADLKQAVEHANTWLDQEKVELVNIETVVLPNLHSSQEEGSEDVDIRTSGEHSSSWHQFVRVWYRDGT